MTVEQARMDQLLKEVYGTTPKRRKRPSEHPWRTCNRCGIQTRSPALCRDCQEVDP